MSTESVMSSNHLILCCPLFPLPSIFPNIRVFSSESALCIGWPRYWNFSICPCNEYSGFISFRIYWFDLLAVQDSQESSPEPQFKSINYLVHAQGNGQAPISSINDYIHSILGQKFFMDSNHNH